MTIPAEQLAKAKAAVDRAKQIVAAETWSGDMRVNATTIIGAGRVLAKRLAELDAEVEKLRDSVQGAICDPGILGMSEYTVASLQAVRGKAIDPGKFVVVERAGLNKLEQQLAAVTAERDALLGKVNQLETECNALATEAYDAAPAVPLSSERIDEIVKFVTDPKRQSGE